MPRRDAVAIIEMLAMIPTSSGMPTIEWRISDAPVPYLDAVREMESRVEAIASGRSPELIWLLEHPPLYTSGTSAKTADLIAPDRFPVFAAGRGGQYT